MSFTIASGTVADASNALILEIIGHNCFPVSLRLGVTAVHQMTNGVPVKPVTKQGKRWLHLFRFSNKVGNYCLPAIPQICV